MNDVGASFDMDANIKTRESCGALFSRHRPHRHHNMSSLQHLAVVGPKERRRPKPAIVYLLNGAAVERVAGGSSPNARAV